MVVSVTPLHSHYHSPLMIIHFSMSFWHILSPVRILSTTFLFVGFLHYSYANFLVYPYSYSWFAYFHILLCDHLFMPSLVSVMKMTFLDDIHFSAYFHYVFIHKFSLVSIFQRSSVSFDCILRLYCRLRYVGFTVFLLQCSVNLLCRCWIIIHYVRS